MAQQRIFIELKGRQMIPIQHQNGLFFPLRQHIRQVFDELIHFVDLVGIILNGVTQVFVFNGGDGNGRFVQDRCARVFAMALYRHGEH